MYHSAFEAMISVRFKYKIGVKIGWIYIMVDVEEMHDFG